MKTIPIDRGRPADRKYHRKQKIHWWQRVQQQRKRSIPEEER